MAVFLGASKKARYPTSDRFCSSVGVIWSVVPMSFCATAMTFMPSCNISLTTAETLWTVPSSMGSTRPR